MFVALFHIKMRVVELNAVGERVITGTLGAHTQVLKVNVVEAPPASE